MVLMADNIEEISDSDLGYLAGLIDGEGSLGIGKSMQRGRCIFTPQIQMDNTDKKIMKKYIEILNKFGLDKKPTITKRNHIRNWNDIYSVTIAKLTDIKSILESIKDVLVGKHERALILLEFVNKRIDANHRETRDNGRFTKTYTGEEEHYHILMKKLNKKRGLEKNGR